MAAIAVTSANTNNINNGNRVVVRTSAGIPYVVLVDATDASIEVWKGDSSTPTSFTEQNTTNNPDATTYGSMSAAIDSTGIIHIVFMEYISKSDDLEYVTFNTNTDVFAGAATINTDLGGESSSVGGLYTSIAIDSNNIPHVAYVGVEANAGTVGYVVRYENRIGGAWNGTGVEVEGQTANLDCVFPDIAIDSNNIPVIAYYNDANDDYTAAIGNVNDAASFTLFDVSSMAGSSSGVRYPSIAVDSSGNQHVAYQYEAGVNDWDIRIRKHNVGDAWSTWQAEENVDTSFASTSPGNSGVSLVIKETKRYIFTEDFDVDDIVYYTDASGSWVGPTTIETGTFEKVKARWSKFATFNVAPTVALNTPNDAATGVSTTPDLVFTGTDTDTKIDYVFVDETASPDVQWNTLTVAGDEIEYNVQVDTAVGFDSQDATTLFDSWAVSNYTNRSGLNGSTIKIGTTFYSGVAQSLARVKFYASKIGSPSGSVVCKLYAITGTPGTDATPTGAALATSNPVDGNSISAWTSIDLVTFVFPTPYALSATTYYAVVMEESTFDSSNYWLVGYGGSNSSENSLGWVSGWSVPAVSYIFYVYNGLGYLLNKLSVTPDATFAGTGDPHPWPSGNQVTYTVQGATGAGTNTYYFDGSDAATTDPNSVWTSDANAFDGSTSTFADASANGSTSSNYLMAEGTNAISGTAGITQVRARAYGRNTSVTKNAAIYTDGLGELLGTAVAGTSAWGSYITLSTPSGGWTWAKVQALETKLYGVVVVDGVPSFSRVEVEVTAVDNTLTANTLYYWRVAGTDPSGSNTYGAWATTRSFTTASAGNTANVFDTINVSEAITTTKTNNTGTIFDTVNVSENIQMQGVLNINVFDSITVVENIVANTPTIVNITGTITADADENSIRTGGRTIILTITGDTWIAAGAASFDLQRDEIIAGLTSAQSELLGWNNVVKALQGVNGVVRTSDIIVTITLDAQPTYFITATETITVTVPGTALNGGNAIVATPTFTIIPDYHVDVFDSVTIAETIQTKLNNYVSVADDITVSESTTLQLVNNVNVFDTVNVSESIVTFQVLNINVFDNVTVAEAITIIEANFVASVSSDVFVSESTTVSSVLNINIFDSVTTTEFINVSIFLALSVFDSISVSENILIEIITAVTSKDVNVFDSINVSENTASIVPSGNASVFDSVGVAETTIVFEPSGNANIFDTINVSESTSSIIPSGNANIFDSITVSENIQITLPYDQAGVADNITISEFVNVTTVNPNPDIDVSDVIFVSDAVEVRKSAQDTGLIVDNISVSEFISIQSGPLFISVSDSITVAETTNSLIPYGQADVFDLITASEDIVTQNVKTINIFDIITASENINAFATIGINVFDSVTTAETTTLKIPSGEASVSDNITVEESVVATSGPLSLSVFDNIQVAENITSQIPLVFVNTFDLIQVSESINAFASVSISVFDSISAVDNISSIIPSGNTSVFDSINISETTSAFIPTGSLDVFDPISVAENINMFMDLGPISTADNIQVSENVSIVLVTPGVISPVDGISVTDSVEVVKSAQTTDIVFDNIQISESITAQVPNLFINIFDSVTVAENTETFIPYNQANIFDLISVSDSMATDTVNSLSVFDSVQTSENITAFSSIKINVFDSVVVTENVSSIVPAGAVDIFDNITITENISAYLPLNQAEINDGIVIAENITAIISDNSAIVFDSVQVSESVAVTIPTLTINISDSIAVAENITANTSLPALNISITDLITVNENIAMNPPHIPDPRPKIIFIDGKLAILIIDAQTIPHYMFI